MGDTARRLLAAFCALALLITALPGTSWTAPMDPDLGPGDYALVQVAHGTAGAVAARATAAGATDVAALDKLDMVTARVSSDALRSLQSDWRVSYVATDAVITAAGKDDHFERSTGKPSPGVATVDADKAWSDATGRGVTVALMDTGIAEHPDLQGSVVARVDFVKDGATLQDPSGHGTFVAGLIAAHGRTFKGVAPDAKLISLRVLDQKGNGTMHAVLAAFDWLLQNGTTMRIKVLNLSFGAPQKSSYHRSLLAGVVESAWFAGITVVAAAGNDGPAQGTVAMPGADPFVITVGSFADQGTLATNDDRESLFSSRGPTRDGFAKPDVLAPGEHIVSLRVPGTAMDLGARARDAEAVAAPYARLTGTSASTAIAAGAAAVVLEAHRNYSPTEVKGALIASGRRIAGTRTPGLDVDDALTVRPARVNAGLVPSLVLLRLLAESGNVFGPGITWDGISWEGISWESVSWEGVAWESVSWEGVTWDGVTWDSVTWELQ